MAFDPDVSNIEDEYGNQRKIFKRRKKPSVEEEDELNISSDLNSVDLSSSI